MGEDGVEKIAISVMRKDDGLWHWSMANTFGACTLRADGTHTSRKGAWEAAMAEVESDLTSHVFGRTADGEEGGR